MALTNSEFQWVSRELGLPSLHLEIRPEWASSHTNSRQAIRRKLKALTGIDFSELGRLPKSERFSISISHCPTVGGFALSEEINFTLGLDLEVPERVRRETVARVSIDAELAAAPTPAHLWVAKEAAFKSLRGPHQPTTMSGLEIRASRQGPHNAQTKGSAETLGNLRPWGYEVLLGNGHKLAGKGLVFEVSGVLAAIFAIPTST